jgi:histidine triad (HIT) family protein
MTSDPDCVFCKIAAGDIPSHRVLESDAALAFLDIGPLSDGHLLLIPRDHFERLEEMPEDVAGEICRLLPRLGKALMQVTQAGGYNVLQNNGRVSGQEVPHVHFHLIARSAGDSLGYRWHPKSYAEGRAQELQSLLQTALGG